MDTTIGVTKRRLRGAAGARIAGLPVATRRAADLAICERLAALDEWKQSRIVLLYHSMAAEVDTSGLIDRVFLAGKTLYLPRVAGPELSFHRIADHEAMERMTVHRFGMREPSPDEPEWIPRADPALVVCPGRAFDRAGNRLGHGGGFYDRLLTRLESDPARRSIAVVGVCYDTQIVDDLPTTARDRPVDLVVTESTTLRCRGRACSD